MERRCEQCGKLLRRHPKHSRKQWQSKRFCSGACSNQSRAIHNQRYTRLYQVWAAIKQRCHNPKHHLFRYYGARGITLFEGWRDDFGAFAADVGPDPGRPFELGRADNDLGYQPGNVRWETRTENVRNTRNTRWVEFDGQRISLIEACEKTGVPYKRAWIRLMRLGWPLARALRP